MSLEITKEMKQNIPIFYLEGKIDFYNAPEIQDILLKEIETGKLKKMIINFKAVDYIDSPGIGALLGIVTKTKTKIRICHTDSRIIHVLELIGLLDFLDIDYTEAESITHLLSEESETQA